MSVEIVLKSVKQHCVNSSGNEQIWTGNNGTYRWTLGKSTAEGILNGVVRKDAGKDESGNTIWIVAGSFKILSDGTIVRWTGLSKKIWSVINQISTETLTQEVV